MDQRLSKRYCGPCGRAATLRLAVPLFTVWNGDFRGLALRIELHHIKTRHNGHALLQGNTVRTKCPSWG
jgi:hypothetical protein